MIVGSKITLINRNERDIDRTNILRYSNNDDIVDYQLIRGLQFTIVDIDPDPEQINGYTYKIYNEQRNITLLSSCYYFLQFWDIIFKGTFIKDDVIYNYSRDNTYTVGERLFRVNAIGLKFGNNMQILPTPMPRVIDYLVRIPSEEFLINVGLKTNSQAIFDAYGYTLYPNNKELKSMINIKIDTKYPLVKFRKIDNNSVFPSEEYGFLLNHEECKNSLIPKPIICYKCNDKIKVLNNKDISNLTFINFSKVKSKDLNIILNTYFKAKVKNTDLSIKLFSNKRKKNNMLEESNKGKLFEITSISKDYVCKNSNNEIHDIIELKHGQISLKFAFSDVELHCINLNGINAPKNRKIEKGAECRIIRNKRLPIKLDSKVKVIKVNKSNKFVKNVIIKTEEGKELVCHVKNLKRI